MAQADRVRFVAEEWIVQIAIYHSKLRANWLL